MNATIETVAPFVWDNDYHNLDQIRPYFADFMVIMNEIKARGEYPYNDSFKGQIPGIANSAKEDTGIYLLQRLARYEELEARAVSFINDGGYRLTDRMPKETERGTLIHTGGTSEWKQIDNAVVKMSETGTILFKLPRQRNWRTYHTGAPSYLFKPSNPS